MCGAYLPAFAGAPCVLRICSYSARAFAEYPFQPSDFTLLPSVTFVLRNALISFSPALTAVPPSIQKMFLTLDGYVYIRSDVEKICGAGKNSDEAVACFRFGKDPDGKPGSPQQRHDRHRADEARPEHSHHRQQLYSYPGRRWHADRYD